MALFDVATENKQEDLIWTPRKAKDYRGVIWPSANLNTLSGDFGHMTFQQIITGNLGIWINNYSMKSGRTFKSRLDGPIAELTILLHNKLRYRLRPFQQLAPLQMQFTLTYTPYMDNVVKLKGGEEYTTFDFHISLKFLEQVARSHPAAMEPFLKRAHNNRFASLYPSARFASWFMIQCMHRVDQLLRAENPDPAQLDQIVAMIVDEAVACGWDDKKNAPLTVQNTKTDEKMRKAVALIMEDPLVPKTTAQLARMLAMNDNTLKKQFKRQTGFSIYQFWLFNRITAAWYMLRNRPDMTIKEIASAIGYQSIQSFSKGFSRHFQCAPKKVQEESGKTPFPPTAEP